MWYEAEIIASFPLKFYSAALTINYTDARGKYISRNVSIFELMYMILSAYHTCWH